MKNIWNGKRRSPGIIHTLPLVLTITAIAMAVYGLSRSEKADDAYMTGSVRSGIVRAAALCYSAEGAYPENIAYLEDNYGISVNYDKYTVHYGYVGGNIPPEVIVTVRKG